MYFVTTKREGYVMFCMSPSERFALGLTEQQRVHLLERSGREWKTLREWPASDHPHTALMTALRHSEEPATASDWIALLPEKLR
jgi:hypothetical protein